MKKVLLFTLLLLALTCAAVFADDLADVQAAGEIRLGVAPEYLPFVFYDRTGALTGIDIALMEEIGQRMGLSVHPVAMAFDGLIDALNIGQVDVIGGAFSKTDDRQQVIDFTRIYYYGDAQFIGLASLPQPETVDLTSFRDLKIGVQKGTSFDQWVKTNLVSAGYVGTRNVYIYPNAAAEMKALDRGDIDLVILDQDIYEDLYRPMGKYKVFYKGFARENYAFGLRKGSALTEAISGHLTDMLKDGTAQRIAERFFSGNYGEAEVTIARPSQLLTPMPGTQQTAVPTVQPAAARTVDYMTFGADITITDGHQVQPGERFRKTWRVKNTGSTTWTPQYSFVYVSGDRMNGQNISIPANVPPGGLVDLSVDLTAPDKDGTYRGYWQMRSPYGLNFGETIWVKVRVKGSGQTVTTPQHTNVQGKDPIDIISFYPDYYSGPKGECLNVNWTIRGNCAFEITVDGISAFRGTNTNSRELLCGQIEKAGDHNVQLRAYNQSSDVAVSFFYRTNK